jgi:hypothetical protein
VETDFLRSEVLTISIAEQQLQGKLADGVDIGRWCETLPFGSSTSGAANLGSGDSVVRTPIEAIEIVHAHQTRKRP